MLVVRTPLMVLVVLGLSAVVPQGLQAGAICGPGAHWVDTCPGGTYGFISQTSADILLDLDRNGTLETHIPSLVTTGSTTIFLGVGSSLTDPHSIVDEVVRIIETNSLFGVTLRAGDGIGNLAGDGVLHSPGRIIEQVGNPLLADSFFDVFFEIELTSPSMILRNLTPMQVVCRDLTQAPPGSCAYRVQNEPTLLFEDGILRGSMTTPLNAAHHFVSPEPSTWLLLIGGMAAFAWHKRRSLG